jgi:hypothetical protein
VGKRPSVGREVMNEFNLAQRDCLLIVEKSFDLKSGSIFRVC